MSQNLIDKFQPKKGSEGTNMFKGPARMRTRPADKCPDPTTYQKDPHQEVEKELGIKHPFMNNEKRFVTPDKGVPPPGAYNLPSAVRVKNKDKPSTFFKSGADKSLQLV